MLSMINMTSPISTFHNRKARSSYQHTDSYLRRFKLLRYREVMRLCDVMETEVPIHGTGTFPTLKICPIHLLQLLRERLESVGVKVHDIRLNGSAATHVLSDNLTPSYKDLDLIFNIDFPDSDVFIEKKHDSPSSYNIVRSRPHILKTGRQKHIPYSELESSIEKIKNDDSNSVDDSGYASSGSSVGGDPTTSKLSSTKNSLKRLNNFLPRSSSIESLSSTSSIYSHFSPVDVPNFFSYNHCPPDYHNWQEIKDATMDVLLNFLPEHLTRRNLNSVMLENIYVRKMVKVLQDSDRWSLISLNNNFGRNIELKFVQSMKRQFEFSVDSFQILLDTYLAFRHAANIENQVEMSEYFHPTLVAESVYGDFEAALRHLRHQRICTHRPEEIRGGGLLRYCNMLARDYTPGECDQYSNAALSTNQEINGLEKRMCARFFIDFGDIDEQRKKLVTYLENHFQGEDELQFQYLLVLRRVVQNSTACLMQHERVMILDLISMLIRETLARNVAIRSSKLTSTDYVKLDSEWNFNKHSYRSMSHDQSCGYMNANERSWNYSISHPMSTSNPVFYSYHENDQDFKPVSINSKSQPNNISQRHLCYWCSTHCYCFCGGGGHYYFCPCISNSGIKSQPFIGSVQPFYYHSGNVTCYYSPAMRNRSDI